MHRKDFIFRFIDALKPPCRNFYFQEPVWPMMCGLILKYKFLQQIQQI